MQATQALPQPGQVVHPINLLPRLLLKHLLRVLRHLFKRLSFNRQCFVLVTCMPPSDSFRRRPLLDQVRFHGT